VSSTLIRQDLVPVAVGYVLLMGALAAGLRRLRRDRIAVPGTWAEPGSAGGGAGSGRAAPGWRPRLRLIRHVAATFAGGYLVLMAVVIAYYYGVARVNGNFLESAFTGCALLLGLSSPAFLAASWLAERRGRRRPARRPHRRRPGPPDHAASRPRAGPRAAISEAADCPGIAQKGETSR
jgi:hypothetical protein